MSFEQEQKRIAGRLHRFGLAEAAAMVERGEFLRAAEAISPLGFDALVLALRVLETRRAA